MNDRWPRRTRAQTTIGSCALAAFCLLTMVVPRHAPAGTVAEQRARLPPAVQCADGVAGTWKSHDYRPRWGQWSIFTMQIERSDGTDALRGTITNHAWLGDDRQSEPGVCQGELHYEVSMDAVGRVQDGQIQFGGVGQWRLDALVCGEIFSGYNLDAFSGPIDLELLEIQAVNNDGGRAVNEPTVFRRVECLAESGPKTPKIVVTPPPFYPSEAAPGDGGGCSAR